MSARGGDADDLLDAAMPPKGGLAAMLSAYFDESKRTSGIFAVAGFAFSKSQAKRCRPEWQKLFSKYGGSHMTDLALKKGNFKGISDQEAIRLIKAAVEIINERASFGVAISCDIAEMDAVLPKWIRGFRGAYSVCCNLAMTGLGVMLEMNNRKDRVAYFFEDGHADEREANYLISRVFDVPELRASYHHYSHTFAAKADLTLLQTADVFAWEWAKYMDETVLGRKRTMRKSLAAILTKGTMREEGYDSDRFKFLHLTGSTLLDYVERIRALGILQIEEERAAKATHSSS